MALVPQDFYNTDTYLTSFVCGLENRNWIAEKMFPRVKVPKEEGHIWVHDDKHLIDQGAMMQADSGAKTPRGDFGMGTRLDYDIEEYKYAFPIPKQVIDNQDSPLDAMKMAAFKVSQLHMLRKEMMLATFMNDDANFTNSVTLGAGEYWDVYATSDPIDDITTAICTLKQILIDPPNACAMSFQVWNKLRFHPDMRGQIGNDIAIRTVTPEQFKNIFGFEYLFIGSACYREDTGDDNEEVWGPHCWIFRLQPNPSINNTTAFGYFLSNQNPSVDKWWETDEEQWVVRQREWWQKKILYETYCYMIDQCLTP